MEEVQKLAVRLVGRKGDAVSSKVRKTAFSRPALLVLKRLTEEKFRWPRREVPVVTLTTEQLHWILDGIDIDAMVRHPVRQYQIAG